MQDKAFQIVQCNSFSGNNLPGDQVQIDIVSGIYSRDSMFCVNLNGLRTSVDGQNILSRRDFCQGVLQMEIIIDGQQYFRSVDPREMQLRYFQKEMKSGTYTYQYDEASYNTNVQQSWEILGQGRGNTQDVNLQQVFYLRHFIPDMFLDEQFEIKDRMTIRFIVNSLVGYTQQQNYQTVITSVDFVNSQTTQTIIQTQEYVSTYQEVQSLSFYCLMKRYDYKFCECRLGKVLQSLYTGSNYMLKNDCYQLGIAVRRTFQQNFCYDYDTFNDSYIYPVDLELNFRNKQILHAYWSQQVKQQFKLLKKDTNNLTENLYSYIEILGKRDDQFNINWNSGSVDLSIYITEYYF